MPLTEAEIKGRENERELWKEATVTRNEAKKATRRTEGMGKTMENQHATIGKKNNVPCDKCGAL